MSKDKESDKAAPGPPQTNEEGGPTPDTPKKLHAIGRQVPGAGGIKIGDLVSVKSKPGTPPSDVVYRVRDVSHDRGRLFASVENYPDPSAGVFGSFHIEELEAPHNHPTDKEGPGGHPAPTAEEEKRYEAAVAHRKKVDEDAAKAIEAENKRLADEQARQRGELRASRRGHHE